jgi:hypothetical protein
VISMPSIPGLLESLAVQASFMNIFCTESMA